MSRRQKITVVYKIGYVCRQYRRHNPSPHTSSVCTAYLLLEWFKRCANRANFSAQVRRWCLRVKKLAAQRSRDGRESSTSKSSARDQNYVAHSMVAWALW